MPQFNDFISFPNAPTWNTVQGPLQGPSLAQPPNQPVAILYAGDASIRVYGYDTGDLLCGCVTIPACYKEGTNLHLNIHWAPITTSTNNVKWTVRYWWNNINTTPVGIAGVITSPDQPGGGIAWMNQDCHMPAISGAGKRVDSMVTFELLRDTAGAPAMAGRVVLHSVCFHYMMDAIGSREPDSK